jgi:hypothetical protein
MHREQMYKSCRRELEKMREDNALLRAEVIAWRAADMELIVIPANEYVANAIDHARAALDEAGVMER